MWAPQKTPPTNMHKKHHHYDKPRRGFLSGCFKVGAASRSNEAESCTLPRRGGVEGVKIEMEEGLKLEGMLIILLLTSHS